MESPSGSVLGVDTTMDELVPGKVHLPRGLRPLPHLQVVLAALGVDQQHFIKDGLLQLGTLLLAHYAVVSPLLPQDRPCVDRLFGTLGESGRAYGVAGQGG